VIDTGAICLFRIKSGEDARRLQGIGKRIAGKIDEMLKSGHIEKLDEIKGDEVNKAVHDLAQVVGIGGQNLDNFFYGIPVGSWENC